MGPLQPPPPPPKPAYLAPPPPPAPVLRVVHGHHGTYHQRGVEIVARGFDPGMTASHFRSKESYLGDGVYFYLPPNARDRARGWVIQKCNTGCDSGEPGWETRLVVLKSEIALGNCLDYNDFKTVELLERCIQKMDELGRPAFSDAQVLHFIRERVMSFDTVIASQEWGLAFPSSKFRAPICCILCVKNFKQIIKSEVVIDWNHQPA